MKNKLILLIDAQDADELQRHLLANPHLDLNNVLGDGWSAFYWALNPPAGKTISAAIIDVLIASGRVNPTQIGYSLQFPSFCPIDCQEIFKSLCDYEDNYIQHEPDLIQPNDLAQMANNNQNTHAPLIVKQYDSYIKALYDYYPGISLTWNTDLDVFIENDTSLTAKEKQLLEKAIKRIKNDSTKRTAEPFLTNAQLLMLIWHALKDTDTAHFVNGIDMSAAGQQERCLSLLASILEAQNVYGENHPACFMGTRHLLIQTLDKVHSACSHTLTLLGKEQVEELYVDYCAQAIKRLSEENASLYKAFLLYFFIEAPIDSNSETELNTWMKRVKEEFWKKVLEKKEESAPENTLSAEALTQLKPNEDTPLSIVKTPSAALADSIRRHFFWLKKGRIEHELIFPTPQDLLNNEHAESWLHSHYSNNLQEITAYLSDKTNESLNPLVSLYLNQLTEEDRREQSLYVWKNLLHELISTRKNIDEICAVAIMPLLENHYKENLQAHHLLNWFKALPIPVKTRFFLRFLENTTIDFKQFALDFAFENQQLAHFPFNAPFTFPPNKDLCGIDLSEVDLTHITFEGQCDARGTSILMNKTLTSVHLESLMVEPLYHWIAAEKGYPLPLRHYLQKNPTLEFFNQENISGYPLLNFRQLESAAVILEEASELNLLNEVITEKTFLYLDEVILINIGHGHVENIQSIFQLAEKYNLLNRLITKSAYQLPLTGAVERGHAEMVNVITAFARKHNLLGEVLNNELLLDAVKNGRTEILKTILEAAREANVIPKILKPSSLIAAIDIGYEETVKMILDEVINHNLLQKTFQNVGVIMSLERAITQGNVKIVKQILQVVNEHNLFLEIPNLLAEAACGRFTETVKIIIESCKSPIQLNTMLTRDYQGKTVHFWLEENGYKKTIDDAFEALKDNVNLDGSISKIKDRFKHHPKILTILERLEKGADSRFNPYWMGSSKKLTRLLSALSNTKKAEVDLLLADKNSELSRAIDMRRIPNFFSATPKEATKSRKLIDKTDITFKK